MRDRNRISYAQEAWLKDDYRRELEGLARHVRQQVEDARRAVVVKRQRELFAFLAHHEDEHRISAEHDREENKQ